MFFGNDRNQMRRFFTTVWQKSQTEQILEPLEQLIAQTLRRHPEYHSLLNDAERTESIDFRADETNPFLHLSMHIALQEQIAIDRPAGIRLIHHQLCQRHHDPHQAEHRMMATLETLLWEAQQQNRPPDEQYYLSKLQQLTLD